MPFHADAHFRRQNKSCNRNLRISSVNFDHGFILMLKMSIEYQHEKAALGR